MMRRLVSILELGSKAHVAWVDSSFQICVWFEIEDGFERFAIICIDLRADSTTRFRLFEKAKSPCKAEALLLDLGCEEEGIAVSIVSRWLDSDVSKQWKISESGIELIQNALLRMGEPTV
jgi:hypothetical protein